MHQHLLASFFDIADRASSQSDGPSQVGLRKADRNALLSDFAAYLVVDPFVIDGLRLHKLSITQLVADVQYYKTIEKILCS